MFKKMALAFQSVSSKIKASGAPKILNENELEYQMRLLEFDFWFENDSTPKYMD
jgi:hypothetical protein